MSGFRAHVNTHSIRVSVLPFLSAFLDRQVYLSPGEKSAFAGEVIIPPEYIGEINITDSLSRGATFSLKIANGAHRWCMPIGKNGLPAPPGPVRFTELLDVSHYITIREGTSRGDSVPGKVFSGRITGRPHQANPQTGESRLEISGGGMESSFQEQVVFIDFENRASQAANLQTPTAAANNPAKRLITSINNIAAAVGELNDPSLLIQQVLTVLTTQFLPGKYAGLPFAGLFDITTGISKQTYTKAFIHVLNWMSQPQFGARLSYWDMLQSLATPPLYELFVSQDNNPIFIDESTILNAPNQGPIRGTVVFRKTPFLYLADSPPAGTNPNPALYYVLPESKIKGFRLEKNEADIFSGINVNLGILDTTASLAINPVTYTPALLEKYAQRVLGVNLEGVGFPDRTTSGESELKANLLAIQNLLSDVFCQAPDSAMPAERAISGTITIHYSGRPEPDEYGNIGGIAKGKILQIVPEPGQKRHRVMDQYDSLMYIESVQTKFSPETGVADQVIGVKWARERSRNPKEFASVQTPPF